MDPLTVIDGMVMPDNDPLTAKEIEQELGMHLVLPEGTDAERDAIFGKAQ